VQTCVRAAEDTHTHTQTAGIKSPPRFSGADVCDTAMKVKKKNIKCTTFRNDGKEDLCFCVLQLHLHPHGEIAALTKTRVKVLGKFSL